MNILLNRIKPINNMNIMDLPDNLDILEEMMSVITMAAVLLDRKRVGILCRQWKFVSC
jgi:hypothetical protein